MENTYKLANNESFARFVNTKGKEGEGKIMYHDDDTKFNAKSLVVDVLCGNNAETYSFRNDMGHVLGKIKVKNGCVHHWNSKAYIYLELFKLIREFIQKNV